jgi:alkyl hydroperoxide reductase subunit AhpF
MGQEKEDSKVMSYSPTILRDRNNWSRFDKSVEEFVTSSDTFDVMVIGCGPAGGKGGGRAANLGKRVAVIEQVFNCPALSETCKYAAYNGLGNLAGHELREGWR